MAPMRRVRQTDKQQEIMGIILREVGAGRFLNVTELYGMISYSHEASYGALRVSLRWLEKHGMLIRERDKGQTRLVPTRRAYDFFKPLV